MRKLKCGLALLLLLALSFSLISCSLDRTEFRISKIVEKNEDGENVYTLEYDTHGNPVKCEVVQNNVFMATIEMEYNEKGLLVSQKYDYWLSAEEEDTETCYTYDEKDNITKVEEFADGVLKDSRTYEYEYSTSDASYRKYEKDQYGTVTVITDVDASGRVAQKRVVGMEGIDAHRYYYDSTGNLAVETVRQNSELILSELTEYAYEYDADGQLSMKKIWEEWPGDAHTYTNHAYSYDEEGKLLKEELSAGITNGMDAYVYKQEEEEISYTYDDRGNVVNKKDYYCQITSLSYYGERTERVWEYDEQDNIIREQVYFHENHTEESQKYIAYEREYTYETVRRPNSKWPDYYEKTIEELLGKTPWNIRASDISGRMERIGKYT